jgi:hypothetical protein
MPKKEDLWAAPIGEGALVLALGAIGWGFHQPFIFASLGPTAYEIVEKPKAKSAHAWNIIAGHFVALGAGHFALWTVHAYSAPKVASAGFVPLPRLWAIAIAATLTTLVTLAIHATQPAALSTTLLVSLGSMQTARDAWVIAVAVVAITVIGEPIRRVRLKQKSKDESEEILNRPIRPAEM